jgi:signal transduction histidine kinase
LTTDDADRALLAERILTEQEERRRLAELLHDGPVQHLSAIAQMLDAGLASLREGETQQADEAFARSLELARSSARDLRALCEDLEPKVLRELGFSAALYQILREAIDQAVRRGAPTRIEVSVRATPAGGAELVVADDGPPERRSAVLEALAERAATLNARFSSEVRYPRGSTIRIEVPPSAARR